MENKTILIVDDEIKILILLRDFLEVEGYNVLEARDGKEALAVYFENKDKIDLMILDVMMPLIDGWTVCREIRKESKDIPIMMLTARSEDYDEVHGFEIGADDYVQKPVRALALIARINAILRRTSEQNLTEQNILTYDDLVLNKDSHEIFLNGESLYLSPKEYSMLIHLIENKNKVISREKLLNEVWGYDYFGGLRTVDTHMNRLRIKLGDFGKKIETVRGFGYRLEG